MSYYGVPHFAPGTIAQVEHPQMFLMNKGEEENRLKKNDLLTVVTYPDACNMVHATQIVGYMAHRFYVNAGALKPAWHLE